MTVDLQRSQLSTPFLAGTVPLWPLSITATVHNGDMPAAIFVYFAGKDTGAPGDRFTAVASVASMLDIPDDRNARGASAYYRTATAYFALRNPGDVEETFEAIKADVAQLIRGWNARNQLTSVATETVVSS